MKAAIRALQAEAAEAGDLDMVAVCDRALAGDGGPHRRGRPGRSRGRSREVGPVKIVVAYGRNVRQHTGGYEIDRSGPGGSVTAVVMSVTPANTSIETVGFALDNILSTSYPCGHVVEFECHIVDGLYVQVTRETELFRLGRSNTWGG